MNEPKILAIDTSTRVQVLGLAHGACQVARRQRVVGVNHASTLLQNIADMLDQQGWQASDLDIVACGRGPGSFTGMRVGMANAKGLARAAGAAIVGVSTLGAIARPVADLHQGYVISAIDARRGEVFTATYDSEMSIVGEERALTPEQLIAHVLELSGSGPVALVGNGIRAHKSLATLTGPGVHVLDAAWDWPSPYSIAMMGSARVSNHGADDLVTLEPNYIRLSDAEITWQKKAQSA